MSVSISSKSTLWGAFSFYQCSGSTHGVVGLGRAVCIQTSLKIYLLMGEDCHEKWYWWRFAGNALGYQAPGVGRDPSQSPKIWDHLQVSKFNQISIFVNCWEKNFIRRLMATWWDSTCLGLLPQSLSFTRTWRSRQGEIECNLRNGRLQVYRQEGSHPHRWNSVLRGAMYHAFPIHLSSQQCTDTFLYYQRSITLNTITL